MKSWEDPGFYPVEIGGKPSQPSSLQGRAYSLSFFYLPTSPGDTAAFWVPLGVDFKELMSIRENSKDLEIRQKLDAFLKPFHSSEKQFTTFSVELLTG